MDLGIRRHGDLEIGDFLQALNKIRSVSVAAGVRYVVAAPFGRVAAQGDEMADAHIPVLARNIVDLTALGTNAGQVGRGRQRGFPHQARDRVMRALAGRTVGAVGDRHESRVQDLEALDRSPQRRFGLLRLRREEFKRHRRC